MPSLAWLQRRSLRTPPHSKQSTPTDHSLINRDRISRSYCNHYRSPHPLAGRHPSNAIRARWEFISHDLLIHDHFSNSAATLIKSSRDSLIF